VLKVLLGRQRELGALNRLLAAARDRRGGAIVVLGEPGIGKTALIERTVTSAQDFWVPALEMIVLAEAFGLVFCLIAAFMGLTFKNEEATQAFGFIWLFPLTFVSAAFVQVSSMPGWLQAFANNQPVTIVINAMRSLALGGPVGLHAWQSVAWLLALTVLFGQLAVRAYRRA
jgi:ABC-type polysaccharide/polyol phosphate export permease